MELPARPEFVLPHLLAVDRQLERSKNFESEVLYRGGWELLVCQMRISMHLVIPALPQNIESLFEPRFIRFGQIRDDLSGFINVRSLQIC